MSFAIYFTEGYPTFDWDGILHSEATIQMGDHVEGFTVPIHVWKPVDYERQWLEGLRRAVSGKKSCMIYKMYDLVENSIFPWWALYPKNDLVYIQDHLVFLKDIGPSFNLNDPYKNVRERETHSDDGEKVSEWVVAVDEIRAFLEK